MKSHAIASLPAAQRAEIKNIGRSIRVARVSQRQTAQMVCDRAFISRATYQRIEEGDPTVAIALYSTAAFVLGFRLQDVKPIPEGLVGLLPQRVRCSGTRNGHRQFQSRDEWCEAMAASIECRGRGLLTAGDLEAQWERQDGRCAMSGIALDATAQGIRRPSVDRIDSAGGYEVGNIQVVLLAFNYLKNDAAQGEVDALLAEMKRSA